MSQPKIYGYCIMTGTNKNPLKSAFKTADRPGNKRVSLGKLVRTSSGHTYPANAITQYHERYPRTKQGFRQWNGKNSTIFGPSTRVTRDPDDKETTWQQRDERHNAMTEAANGIDYPSRPPGYISKEQQLEIYEKNTPKIKILGDDDDKQSKEEVQGIIEDLKKQLNEQMDEYEKEDLKDRIAEYEDQLIKIIKIAEYEDQLINMGGAKKNRKTKSKRKAKRKTNRKTKSKKMTKKKTKRKAKGNTKKRR